jgi:hypothetical protein
LREIKPSYNKVEWKPWSNSRSSAMWLGDHRFELIESTSLQMQDNLGKSTDPQTTDSILLPL